MPERVLSWRELNRTTLARQLLLERANVPLVEAVEQVAGLQAQEPASPSIGLWSRVANHRHEELIAATERRELVKATLMRATLHLVSARDYRPLVAAITPVIRGMAFNARGAATDPEDLPRIAAGLAKFAREPRLSNEIKARMTELSPGADVEDLWWRIRRYQPFIHAPSRDVWGFGQRPRFVDPAAWLGKSNESPEEGAVHLVRRYLGAFGPATRADLVRWSRVPVFRLKPAFDVLEPEIRTFRNENGAVLYDLEGLPLPPADLDAPVRFLPMWDNLLLAYTDRERVGGHRARLENQRGDYYPSFLVDGELAGLWRVDASPGSMRVEATPFGRLTKRDRVAVDEEAERLAAFLDPLDRRTFSRFDRYLREFAASRGSAAGTPRPARASAGRAMCSESRRRGQ